MNPGAFGRRVLACGVLIGLLWAAPVHAFDAERTATVMARQYLARAPLTVPNGLSAAEAMDVQARFVAALSGLGTPVGYKAGLTNPVAQAKLGIGHPVRGTLLSGMLLTDGATLPARFGAVPVGEGDLVVRVADDRINEARTPAEALKYLDAVMPFMELPDLMFPAGTQVDAPAFIAANVGARYGVLGAPIPLGGAAWNERLAAFHVSLVNGAGEEVGRGDGKALLGHPLNAVVWIRDSLRDEGKRLKPGDLLSLGSLTPLVPVTGPGSLTARYIGLDPAREVTLTVRFTSR